MKLKLLEFWNRARFTVFVTLLSCALLYLRYGQQDITEHLKLWGTDLLIKLAPHVEATDVVLVEIDDQDTKSQGQWPWPRASLAHLVERLRQNGASVIVFADVFSEADLAKTDAAFAKSIMDNGVILSRSVDGNKIVDPVEPIRSSALALGFNNLQPDPNGVVRRLNLFRLVNDRAYYSLGVEAIAGLMGEKSAEVNNLSHGYELKINDLRPWAVESNSLWRPKFNRNFQHINATARDFAVVKNKIVIVGVAAQAVNNWVITPDGPMRNHWVQAHVVQSLIDHNNIVVPAWADMLEMLVSILILASILKAARNKTPYACIPVYAGGMAVVLLGAWLLFSTLSLSVDWVWPTLSCTSVFLLTFHYHLAKKRSAEWAVSRKFGDSVSNSVLKRLQKNHEAINTAGEIKEISVLYADLRGFARLAASYAHNAQGLVQLIHNYMDQTLPAITRNSGTVDKLVGDGVVAFWNAPHTVDNHAAQSVKAAMEMLAQIRKLNQMLTPEEVPFVLDIGINTGIAVLGDIGSKRKFNYTALGETVRTADGLENLCKQYGVNIILGETTATQVASQYHTLELDTVDSETGTMTRIYTVLDEIQAQTVRESHNRMLDCYYNGHYDQAIKLCRELRNLGILTEYYQAMHHRIKIARMNQAEENTSST